MRENWDEFMSECCENQRMMYRKTEAGRQRKEVNLQMEELLNSYLTTEQKAIVDDVMLEHSFEAEQNDERLYQQGMKDGIWLMKKLGGFE